MFASLSSGFGARNRRYRDSALRRANPRSNRSLSELWPCRTRTREPSRSSIGAPRTFSSFVEGGSDISEPGGDHCALCLLRRALLPGLWVRSTIAKRLTRPIWANHWLDCPTFPRAGRGRRRSLVSPPTAGGPTPNHPPEPARPRRVINAPGCCGGAARDCHGDTPFGSCNSIIPVRSAARHPGEPPTRKPMGTATRPSSFRRRERPARPRRPFHDQREQKVSGTAGFVGGGRLKSA